ncbi:MAG TPA: hypothetical protein VKR54_02415 [Candidatus Babeliales bacterium]|nr:hypothetical protein [Candidatus Babeliales bacterium]
MKEKKLAGQIIQEHDAQQLEFEGGQVIVGSVVEIPFKIELIAIARHALRSSS